MKKKLGTWVIFLFSAAALYISLRLFWNMGVYVDEHNTSPSVVCGGDFWLLMDWLRLGLLSVTTLVSGFQLLPKQK